jgi:hypothetical protein
MLLTTWNFHLIHNNVGVNFIEVAILHTTDIYEYTFLTCAVCMEFGLELP